MNSRKRFLLSPKRTFKNARPPSRCNQPLTTLFVTVAVSAASVSITRAQSIVDPNVPNAFGLSYDTLTGAWWNWIGQFPPEVNPVTDETGEQAFRGNLEDVFFLAGNFGETTVRNVNHVPDDKPIFFPVINNVFIAFPGETLEEARSTVNANTDAITEKHASIDGVMVDNLDTYRAQSPPEGFVFHNVEGGIFWDPAPLDEGGFSASDYPNSVADGFWLLLEPLSAGTHTIRFGGAANPDPSTPEPDFDLDVTYHLNVVPEPSSVGLLSMGVAIAMFKLRRRPKQRWR